MNWLVYLGAALFAVGFLLWVFCKSKLQAYHSRFVPPTPHKLAVCQFLRWLGIVFAVAGIVICVVACR